MVAHRLEEVAKDQFTAFDSSRWTIPGRGTTTAANCIAAARHLGEKLRPHGPIDFGRSRDPALPGRRSLLAELDTTSPGWSPRPIERRYEGSLVTLTLPCLTR